MLALPRVAQLTVCELTSACLSAGAPLVGRGGYKAASPWRRSSATATVRQRQHTGASDHSARTHCQCSAQIVGKREARAAARPQLGVRFACSHPSHVGRCQTIGGRLVSSLAALLHIERVPTSSAAGVFTSVARRVCRATRDQHDAARRHQRMCRRQLRLLHRNPERSFAR